jgi:hypothetical protein
MRPFQSMVSAQSMLLPPASAQALDNVIDFGPAYAAYRTAGGHASTQIIPHIMEPSATPTNPMQSMAEAWSWMFPFAPGVPRSGS